ncbi:type II secretion system F family protein [Halovenus salina]|uniref:type II secretion system F family protein n=1 Tax=Halovenus salina TaxID=1510225 RepID=UPI002260A8F7|nr:type II secretion system F family protein [Halovenus salina]
MNPVWLFPPLVVVVSLSAYVGGKLSPQIEGTLNRIARVLFGRFVSVNEQRENRIQSAFIETSYRTYAAKTYLYAVIGLIAGGIAGAYALAGVLAVLEPIVQLLAGLPRTITTPLGITPDWEYELASQTRWLVLLGGGAVSGLLTGTLAYVFRWQLPASDAEVRRRAIDEGLPRTTAFMFALSRGGMEFAQILQILTDNREVYGETASEFSVASREMNLFGTDMISAMRRMAERTPSEQFKTFSENLSSILQSGRELPGFLEEQYERFREDAEERQEEILDVLATIAEGYVTVLVAGVLFLITILLVFGLTTTDTLWILKIMVYLLVPLANAGFAVFLQQKLDQLGVARRSGGSVLSKLSTSTPIAPEPNRAVRQPDGGYDEERELDNRRMLDLYDQVRGLKAALGSPLRVFLRNPAKLLWVTVPIALVAFFLRLPSALQADGIAIRILDDLVVQSVLFVLGTYAIVREVYKRRIDRIEAATPEMLERLASLNEAGMSVVEGFQRVRGSDLGVLTPEVERIWRDIEFGANIDDALIRFGRRVRTTAITRVVTLLTNAMRASGEMGPVLRIASEQARAEVKLRRQRRQQMFTYLVVIYVSFAVFLVIILAVNEVLVPSLPDNVALPEGDQLNRLGASPDAFARFGEVDKAAYTLVFFHAAIVQAVAAGFIAGQLGEGSLRDGVKHAAIMLGIAYVAVLLLTSPVASISALDTTSDGESVFLDSASLSEGGYVAVYGGDSLDDDEVELLGYTEYLSAGSHSDVFVPLQEGTITQDQTVLVVAHRETNGNEQFDFALPYRSGESQADGPYQGLSDRSTPGVEVDVTYIGDPEEE